MRRVALLVVAVLGLAPASPCAGEPRPVDFERHVAPLLTRLGCSAGACHGSFQGKGGLTLSLFGAAPGRDFLALTRDGLARRIDRQRPERSLLLLKPTGRLEHGGGVRIRPGSPEEAVLRAWISQGAQHRPGSGELRSLTVEPHEHLLKAPGQSVQLRVRGEFADGSAMDLTPFCAFRARDESVASVLPGGVVRAQRPGSTAIVVSYSGHWRSVSVLVARPAPAGFVYPEVSEANLIDRLVFGRLRRLGIVPSELAGDDEFLRRLYLDTVGTLPPPDEVRAFLASTDPDRRARKIAELLAHPDHASLWALRYCDITGCNLDEMEDPGELRPKRAKMWHDWFRRRFAENAPYDQIARGLLLATSKGDDTMARWVEAEAARLDAARRSFTTDYADRPFLDLYWRKQDGEGNLPLEPVAERTAAAFLGVRLECAQCHRHPFDRWTQEDYLGFVNVFAPVHFGRSAQLREAVADVLEERRQHPQLKRPPLPALREVFVHSAGARWRTHPVTGDIVGPRAPGGPVLPREGDPREGLVRWLLEPDNPFFARAFVNRAWAAYFGTGLVDPVDGFSLANPPCNEELLDALAKEFTASGYDIRRLERLILSSRTYQLSSRPNATNRDDVRDFSHARPRRLLAEVVVDALGAALGATVDFGPGVPKGSRAIEVAPNRVRAAYASRVFRVFGRPSRVTVCDCERPAEPALPQTLFLMSDPELLRQMQGGRLAGLLAKGTPDGKLVEELFLATLSRFPDAGEKEAALAHLREMPDRKSGATNLLWALLNTREFILNH